jgi:hypothetical protein
MTITDKKRGPGSAQRYPGRKVRLEAEARASAARLPGYTNRTCRADRI